MSDTLTIILKVLAAFAAARILAFLIMRIAAKAFPDSRVSTRRWLGFGFIMVLGAFLAALLVG